MFLNTAHAAKTATADVMTTLLQANRRQWGGPLLLVYGAGEDEANASRQAHILTEAGYDVVAFDHGGHGEPVEAQADGAARLVSGLGVGAVTVVGIGSGALVALTLAMRHPSAVECVVTWEPGTVGSTSLVLKTFAAREFHPRDIGMVIGNAPSVVIAAAVCDLALRIRRTATPMVPPHRGASVTHAEVLTHNGVPDPRRWAGWSANGRAL